MLKLVNLDDGPMLKLVDSDDLCMSVESNNMLMLVE